MEDYRMAGRSLKAVGVLQLIGVIGVFAAILIPTFTTGGAVSNEDFLLMLIILLPVFSWILGRGVSQQKRWARNVAIIYCLIMLTGFPMGTLIGAYILFYLIRDRDATSPNSTLHKVSDVPAE